MLTEKKKLPAETSGDEEVEKIMRKALESKSRRNSTEEITQIIRSDSSGSLGKRSIDLSGAKVENDRTGEITDGPKLIVEKK